MAGTTLVDLAAHQAVAPPLRGAARGRQQAVFEGLRLPGPPVALVADRWLVGWACESMPPCQGRGLFLAVDAEGERILLVLVRDGRPETLAPRNGRVPPALAAAFAGFAGTPGG